MCFTVYITKYNKSKLISNSIIGEDGYICQLFRIFKGDENFCFIESKNFNCPFCKYENVTDNNNINQFFQINEDDLKFSGIEELYLNKYNRIIKQFCLNCQLSIGR